MTSPPALFQAAIALHQAGRLQEAVAAYDRVIAAAPDHAAAYVNRGVALRGLGRLEAALSSYDAAIAIDPGHAEAHANRGNVLQALQRFNEARESLETACRLKPGDATARNNLGNTLRSLGQAEAALACFDAAIALRPAYPTAHFNRGLALTDLQRLDDALASYDRAIALKPDYAEAHGNRGNLLIDQQRFDEGLPSLRALLRLRPDDPAAHNKLGVALMNTGALEAAVDCFNTALSRDPGFADAQVNRGLTEMTLGRLAQAWRDYDARWNQAAFAKTSAGQVTPALRDRLRFGLTAADLTGRSVMVVGEQGVGDVIMFASMLPDLMRVAGPLALVCEPRLRRLMSASFPNLRMVSPSAATGAAAQFDHVLPIGGLGRLFRDRREAFPGAPYLTPADAIRETWLRRLGPTTARLRVGLSWRGGTPKTGQKDRSIALEDLRPLLDAPDCEFVSLQYGDVGEEVAAINERLSRPIRRFAPAEIDDFEDLAGLVRALDVVVSVQTALVHVAGSVGAPVLVMARRYGATLVSLPWYGSVELLRQDETRTWGPVIRQVAERLARFES